MKKILVILSIFVLDRIIKIYLINLQDQGTDVDFYISSFLNIYLVWNTGIGFGLIPLEANLAYHFVTTIIFIIIFGLIYFLIKYKGNYSYLIAIILGGSLGNLFDRIYYSAVLDFIDISYKNYHWFIFNVADIFISLGIICLIFAELLNYKKINEK